VAVRLRPWSLQLHLWTGLTLGALLCVVCASGAVSTLRHDLDRWQHAQIPESTPSATAPWDAAVAAALAHWPGSAVQWVAPPAGTGGPTEVWVVHKHGPSDEDDELAILYCDPRSGALLGSTRDGNVSGVMSWIARLHTTLFLGQLGAWLLGFAAIALSIFCISGVILWWPGVKRLGGSLRWRWSAGGFVRHYDVHRLLGMVSLPILILVAVTGLMFEFPWMRIVVRTAGAGWSDPTPWGALPDAQRHCVAPSSSAPLGPQALAAAAEAAVPGTSSTWIPGPALIHGDDSGSATAPIEPLGVYLTYPNNIDTYAGGVVVYLDPWTGAVHHIDDARRLSPGGWFDHNMFALHTGWWGPPGSGLGWTMRIVYVLCGLVPIALFITGLAIWFHRRHQARRAAAGRSSATATANDAATALASAAIREGSTP
jgi:uncharacterized iron-regulated membrane protein